MRGMSLNPWSSDIARSYVFHRKYKDSISYGKSLAEKTAMLILHDRNCDDIMSLRETGEIHPRPVL